MFDTYLLNLLHETPTYLIVLYLLNGFIWSAIMRVYLSLSYSGDRITIGDLIYCLTIGALSGYVSVAMTILWLGISILSKAAFFKKPLL